MKAIVVSNFGGPEVLEYTDVEIPKIGANQVLIRVEATSVNFADIKSRYGGYHGAGKPPFIPGLDVAGVIAEVGSDVMSLKAGQRVIAFPKTGSYAEYVLADEDLTFVLPDEVDFDVAAACPIVSFTSYKLFADIARIEPGETVLIHAAAGGIGTTATQMAKILGAGQVIGTVGDKVKMQTVLDAGADHVICRDHFVEKVQELTNGQGADIILDSIAGKVGEDSMNCLAMYGRLVNFGNASGESAKFKTSDLHASCRSILGFSLGTTRGKRPHLLRPAAEQVFSYLKDGQLTIKIGKAYPLEEAAEAQKWVESRQSIGKVLLRVR